MQTKTQTWPLAVTIVLLLALVIGAPLIFGNERVEDVRPAGEIGSGLPLSINLQLVEPSFEQLSSTAIPAVSGGGR